MLGLSQAASRVVSLIALACVLVVILLTVAWCNQRDEARKAQDQVAQSDGRTVSAVEAITEIGKLSERGQATDKEVSDAHEAIRQADPAVRDAVARARLRCLQDRSACDGVQ